VTDLTANRSRLLIHADLGDNLIVRSARREDAAAVAELVYGAHAAKGNADDAVRAWVLDLMERPHPTLTVEDVLVVENTRDGSLVSTLNLIPHTWTYGGIPFGVGRVELVATHPSYEGRGLVRRQFEVLHRLSGERGHLLQAITGIPNFYHQFGYEYALATGGGRFVDRAEVPPLPPGEHEPFRFRPASEQDLSALLRIERAAAARSLVSCLRDEAMWRYDLSGRSPSSMLASRILVLETRPSTGDAQAVGYAVLGSGGFPGGSPEESAGLLRWFELAPGIFWEAATGALLRHLAGAPSIPRTAELQFAAGEHHPAYAAVPGALARPLRADAWYIRLPNLPVFLHRLAPVLEARLAASPVADYSGSLTLSFYRTALRLHVDRGRISSETWSDPSFRSADACFPGRTFHQLVLGYRSLAELEFVTPDCWTRAGTSRQLIEALFPKADSSVWPTA
jgi:predicted N-acetyltransferase YhbS